MLGGPSLHTMAVPRHPSSFLQSALSIAPLNRGEACWAWLRFCDVLPDGAKADFQFVRSHAVGRNEPDLPQHIAQSLLDRSTPKGRKPDPGGAQAKALWKAWEANGFKAPKYVARWPNHSGTPTTERDTFPPTPEGLGEVLSATTNVHDGRVERDYVSSIFFGIVVGGLPGALIGFIATQILGWLAVPFTTGATVVALLIAFWVHLVRNSRTHSTWVGTEGLATVTDGKVLVFRFERADRVDRRLTDEVSNGAVVGKRADYTWLNAKNRVVHRARALFPDDPTALPETSAAHFVRAADDAWKAFHARERE